MTNKTGPCDAPVPPRRKRFQFSLRTLMLCVLTYGALWVLTIRWGGGSLRAEHFNRYREFSPKINGSGTAIDFDVALYTIHGHAVSPAPFFVFWRWDSEPAFLASRNSGGAYFWFFGYQYELGSHSDPYPGALQSLSL